MSSSKQLSRKAHSYPKLLKRKQGQWVADPPAWALKGMRGKRREQGVRQLRRLARVVNFMETHLRIVTKQGELVPFVLNAVQIVILQLIALCWLQLRPAQLLVPKSRQMGVSTFCQGLFFSLAFLGKHYRCLTVAHREDSARMIFRMSQVFEQWLPSHLQHPLKTRTKGCLEWRDTGSMTQVATIGTGDGLGMGFTLNGLHGSEVAVWAQRGDAKAAWTSVAPAVADNPDTVIVFESTPDGSDPFFYDLCVKSLHGFGDWESVFLPWYLDPGYRVSKRDYALRVKRHRLSQEVDYTLTVEEEELAKLVREQAAVTGEEWIRWPCELELEQILWRRLTVENKCSGDVELFNRFYPSTWEMAFRSREACLFDQHTIERLKAMRREPELGAMHLVRGSSVFRKRERLEQRRAKWDVAVWEKPEKTATYVIGADVAEGVDGGDASAAYVGRVYPELGKVEVVAAIHGTIDPDLFAEQLDLLGQHYGNALLAVEVNRTYEVMRTLRKRNYPNLYWRSDPTNPKSKARHPGWHTNPKTRPIMLAIVRAMARDNDLAAYDGGIPEEMGHMVPGSRGKWEARSGQHDDRIMALGILCAVTGFRDRRGRRRRVDAKRQELVDKANDEAVAVMHRRRAFIKARRQKDAGSTSVTL